MKFEMPTSQQCSENQVVYETEKRIAHAIWYPQMGGYVGKAIALCDKESDSCFELFVWHDGQFPFGDDANPVEIHHCNPAQFIEFGRKLQGFLVPKTVPSKT